MRFARTTAALLVLAACGTTHTNAARLAVATSGGDVAGQVLREQTADEQVRQALNRLAFGARPGDAERVRALGVDRWIAAQLSPSSIDDRATEQFVAHFPVLAMSPEKLLEEYPQPQQLIREKRAQMARDGQPVARDSAGGKLAGLDLSRDDSMRIRQAGRLSRQLLTELQTAKVARAVMSDRQLEEVMVDFWENHFTVFAGKGPSAISSALTSARHPPARARQVPRSARRRREESRDALLSRQLGEHGGLGAPVLAARAHGARSQTVRNARQCRPRAGPGLNENYARELMELHTLGVDGGYTQQDVDRGRARVHRVDRGEAAPERRRSSSARDARRGREDRARPQARGRARDRGW